MRGHDLTNRVARLFKLIAAIPTNAYVPGGTDVALADGGTGASLVDPNADRILFWDDSAGTMTWLDLGTNLSITGTTLNGAAAGMTLLETLTLSSGTVVTTSASFSGYRHIYFEIAGASTSSAAGGTITMTASSDGGSTYGGTGLTLCAMSNATNLGFAAITLKGIQLATQNRGAEGWFASSATGAITGVNNTTYNTGGAAALTNLRFTITNAYDAGVIRVYGLP